MSGDDIFENRENLIEIWKEERRSRDFSAQLMWENVKYFTAIITALITAHMALFAFFRNAGIYQWMFYVPLIIFPGSILLLSYYGERDLKRRWIRVLEAIVNLIKIEGILGLYIDISNKLKNLKEDKFLFKRYKETADKFSSSDEFIKSEKKRRQYVYLNEKSLPHNRWDRFFVGCFGHRFNHLPVYKKLRHSDKIKCNRYFRQVHLNGNISTDSNVHRKKEYLLF